MKEARNWESVFREDPLDVVLWYQAGLWLPTRAHPPIAQVFKNKQDVIRIDSEFAFKDCLIGVHHFGLVVFHRRDVGGDGFGPVAKVQWIVHRVKKISDEKRSVYI